MTGSINLTSAGDSQSSGYDTSSNLTVQSQEHLRWNAKRLCTPKIITIITFFLVILTITLTTTLAGKHKSPTEHKSCLDGWIGYLGKCFYFSENTTTWAASQDFCASYEATLAVVSTVKQLDFLKRYSDHSQYWIGLSQKPGQTWKWIDGTTYSDWLKAIGIGECAYLHKNGISGSSTHLVRKWICSKPDACTTRS
ncbi:PREDICTED: C-type lectin domain family 2 member A-like [Miniopterus natalensis]|uniref:C-type lectin domain family 2 member A-like n=1 Tax=Miniopterus natalensis TaxID=291302 RepID=UPI0007A72026|nr:PREDICTED: C-type lectin domain family 2 member A-like [Miniopterus natalensis]